MKRKSNQSAVAAFSVLTAFTCTALAQTTWNGSSSGSWATAGNWTGGIPDSADLVTYGAGTGVGTAVTNGTQTLDGSFAVLGFAVGNNAASPIVINNGTGSNSLTIGASGILLNSGTGGSFTCNPDITMTAAQSFTTGTGRSITVNNVANGGFTLTVNTAGSTSTTAVNGELSGAGGLTKSGIGVLTLSRANTYTGSTVVNQGFLKVAGSGVLGGVGGSTVDAGNIVFGQNLNSGRLEFETNANLGAAGQIRFRNTGGTAGLGGALVYVGTTAQTVSKAIQCDTSIGVRLSSDSVGGSVDFSGSWAASSTSRPAYLGGTGTGDNTISGAITASTLTKTDAGKWILSGTNGYVGLASINNGTLLATKAAALPGFNAASRVSVANGATLAVRVGGAGEWSSSEIESLLGATTAAFAIGSNIGMNVTTGNTFSYANNIGATQAAKGLVKSGEGTLGLSGNNTYTGSTNITAGTLLLGSATALPASAPLSLSGGTLRTDGFDGSTGALSVSGLLNNVIDFSSNTSSLTFADSSLALWTGTLKIFNWDGGILAPSGGTESMLFPNAGSLTSPQLAAIQFYSDNGISPIGSGAGFLSGTGELVPVPEPSAAVLGIGLLGMALYRRSRV